MCVSLFEKLIIDVSATATNNAFPKLQPNLKNSIVHILFESPDNVENIARIATPIIIIFLTPNL
ncbi:hypothetical protein ALNOE001_08270 [Candidatus Methanobinarius endosymbioticus]|uniref:Uncharacterized protein n=1 Tax=Candidatus Methanobinarius endosymbioticus TaxID=2006182 RepID=A0A366MCP5_9EURY|nr:hypothetical protein ALNOE001_08270 [Candidatus Methanobinarius endosymbioticus]